MPVVVAVLPLWALLVACAPGVPALDGEAPDGDPTDDTADGDDSGDTSETGDSPDTDPGDSGDSADTDSGEVPVDPVADVVVRVHPEVATILEVDWTQARAADAVWLEFTFEDDVWMTSPEAAGDVGAHHEVVLGVPGETPVTLRIVSRVDGEELASADYTGTTGTVPASLLAPAIKGFDAARASPDRWMLGSVSMGTASSGYGGPFWAFVLDRKGRYVWYHLVPDNRCSLYVQPAQDGSHVIVDGNTAYVWDPDVEAGVLRTTLDLAWQDDVVIDDFGFAVEEAGDGSLLYEGDDHGEMTLERWFPDGTSEVVWSCTAYFKEHGYQASGCMPNTIVWDADRDSAMWSMFMNDTVMEVDLGSGDVVRQFGQLPDSWATVPAGSVVDYQHYPNWTPDDTILVSTHVKGDHGVQRTREFAVDDAGETLTEVWTWGEEVAYYAEYAGEAQRLPNGNTLVGYGTGGALVEVTPDHVLAWDLQWSKGAQTYLIGHMTLVDDLYALNRGAP